MTETNTQVRLRESPAGQPEPDHFEVVQGAMPEAGEGQLLCRNLWLSLDPYMRSQIAGRHISGSVGAGDLLTGETVAEVVQSHSPDFAPGQLVRGFGHWQRFCALDAAAAHPLEPQLASQPQRALGSLGMPGLTAWAGLVKHADIQAGETLLLPAATGAVGSVAAGLARHMGAQVVGVVGGAKKRDHALRQLGCVACVDRKAGGMAAALDQACPEGVDVYFDLVGGELLHLAAERLKLGGRIVLCGLMAEYNSAERGAGPAPGLILRARARVSGLVVYDYEPHRREFVELCAPLIESGAIRPVEDITQGLENAPEAFCRLMRGENFGKVLVRL